MNKIVLIIAGIAVVIVGLFLLGNREGESDSTNPIIARAGIHWHPELKIKIKGEDIEIPSGIGLIGAHNLIHTHDADGIMHLEFSGKVTEGNVRLGEFFNVWGKKFNSECIFENCNGEEGKVKMFVNGEPNTEFESYVMQNEDVIEIVYE